MSVALKPADPALVRRVEKLPVERISKNDVRTFETERV